MNPSPGLDPQDRSRDVSALLDLLRVREQRDMAAIGLILNKALSQPSMQAVRTIEPPGIDRAIYALTKPQLVDLLKAANFESWQPYDWLEMDESGLKGNDHRLADYGRRTVEKSEQAYRGLVAYSLAAIDCAGGSQKHTSHGVDYYLFDQAMLTGFLREMRFASWSVKEWDPSVKTQQVLRDKAAGPVVGGVQIAPPAPPANDAAAARKRPGGPQ